MSFRMEEQYTADMEHKDYCVFLKTDFKEPVYNANGTVVGSKLTDENYVYAIFPNRHPSRNKTSMMCESYAKPKGDVKTWSEKLERIDTLELDALSEDKPATFEEFGDLLIKLAADNTLRDGTIVIEDATAWQKLGSARKRLYRQQIEDLAGLSGHSPNENVLAKYQEKYGANAVICRAV